MLSRSHPSQRFGTARGIPARGRGGAQTRFRSALHSSRAELSALKPGWGELISAAPRPHLEHQPEWLTLGHAGGRLPFAVSLRSGGELLGVAPMLVRPFRFSVPFGRFAPIGFPVLCAEMQGGGPLCSADEQLIGSLVGATGDPGAPHDLLALEGVPLDSPLWRALASPEVRQRYWVFRRGRVAPHRFIDLPESFDAYLAKFCPKSRSRLRGKLRKLESACSGTMEVIRVTGRQDIDTFLAQAAAVSKTTWQARRMSLEVRAGREEKERFGEMADRGWLRSYLMRGPAGPISYALGYQCDGTYYFTQPGYDPAWAPLSPGTLLIYRMIEDLYAWNTPRVFDFGLTDSEYKRFYANRSEDAVDVYLLRRTPYMAMAGAVNLSLSMLRRGLVAAVEGVRLQGRLRRTFRGQSRTRPSPTAETG